MNEKITQQSCSLSIEEFPIILTQRAQEMAQRATKAEGDDNFFCASASKAVAVQGYSII